MEKTEKQLWFYSSLLIALLLNSGKLFALRENGIAAENYSNNLRKLRDVYL